MIELLRQVLRGEPVALAGVVTAVLTSAGVAVSSETVAQIVAAVAPLALAWLARRKVTPTASPRPGEGAPVFTFKGRR